MEGADCWQKPHIRGIKICELNGSFTLIRFDEEKKNFELGFMRYAMLFLSQYLLSFFFVGSIEIIEVRQIFLRLKSKKKGEKNA